MTEIENNLSAEFLWFISTQDLAVSEVLNQEAPVEIQKLIPNLKGRLILKNFFDWAQTEGAAPKLLYEFFNPESKETKNIESVEISLKNLGHTLTKIRHAVGLEGEFEIIRLSKYFDSVPNASNDKLIDWVINSDINNLILTSNVVRVLLHKHKPEGIDKLLVLNADIQPEQVMDDVIYPKDFMVTFNKRNNFPPEFEKYKFDLCPKIPGSTENWAFYSQNDGKMFFEEVLDHAHERLTEYIIDEQTERSLMSDAVMQTFLSKYDQFECGNEERDPGNYVFSDIIGRGYRGMWKKGLDNLLKKFEPIHLDFDCPMLKFLAQDENFEWPMSLFDDETQLILSKPGAFHDHFCQAEFPIF